MDYVPLRDFRGVSKFDVDALCSALGYQAGRFAQVDQPTLATIMKRPDPRGEGLFFLAQA